MRTVTLLDNADASVQQISDFINFDQRSEWKLFIKSSSLDGEPQLFIESNNTKSACVEPTGDWTVFCNPLNLVDGSFPINDDIITIEKKDFKSNWFRLRLEPNGNTTGNITIQLVYKMFT